MFAIVWDSPIFGFVIKTQSDSELSFLEKSYLFLRLLKGIEIYMGNYKIFRLIPKQYRNFIFLMKAPPPPIIEYLLGPTLCPRQVNLWSLSLFFLLVINISMY